MGHWPSSAAGALVFGADHNPEQWPRSVWHEDLALMRAAGVNLVNLGIFAWAQVQPAAASFDWDWLDEILDLLHENGIAVDLGTGTSSPPPWLTTLHPEILPVTADGRTLSPGGRQQWRPSSPVFRRYALDHVRTLASRYAEHPALTMWHVSNELGCHNVDDFSDDAAVAFRSWLQTRNPGDHQLHGHGQRGQRHGLSRLGKRSRSRRQRPLPDRRPAGRVRGAVLLGQPHSRDRRR